MSDYILSKHVERLIRDTRESILEEKDELPLLLLSLEYLVNGASYEDAIQMAASNLSDKISNT